MNLHGFLHTHLKRKRIPFRHPRAKKPSAEERNRTSTDVLSPYGPEPYASTNSATSAYYIKITKCPRAESNCHFLLRREMLCPLSYEGESFRALRTVFYHFRRKWPRYPYHFPRIWPRFPYQIFAKMDTNVQKIDYIF